MRIIPHVLSITSALSAIVNQDNNTNSVRSSLSYLYLSLWDFDEEWYLSQNPDLKAAIPSDAFPSGWDHFKAVGYFEGRFPIEPSVDDEWYLSTYPDVSAAIIDGSFADAGEHFVKIGYSEGRLPKDPQVDQKWYRPRFMGGAPSLKGDGSACTEHFVKFGYRDGAFPGPCL